MTREKAALAEEHIDLESVLTDGRMTVPVPEGAPRIRVRELDGWCRANGRDPSSLTDEELRRFAS